MYCKLTFREVNCRFYGRKVLFYGESDDYRRFTSRDENFDTVIPSYPVQVSPF